MADSASDPKVEDVLSSVRRLVSQDIPRRTSRPAPDAADALVLTSSHRIEPKSAPAAPSSTPSSTPPERRSLEQRIAELEAAVDHGGAGEFEPDGSEDQAQHRPDRIVYTRPTQSDNEATLGRATQRLSEIALIETGPATDDAGDAETPLEFRRDTGEIEDRDQGAPMAEDVPPLPPIRGDVRPFSDPDVEVERIDARIGQDEHGRTVISKAPEFARVANTLPEEDEEFEQALTDAVRDSLSADDTASETTSDDDWTVPHDKDVVTEDQGEDQDHPQDADEQSEDDLTKPAVEPSESDGAVYVLSSDDQAQDETQAGDTLDPEIVSAEEAPQPEDAVLAAVLAETADTSSADETPDPDVDPVEAETLTETRAETALGTAPETDAVSPTELAENALAAISAEDAMRLLVGRMMRDELQGELGVRMTQNVRKLVRREVQRAFAERDLR